MILKLACSIAFLMQISGSIYSQLDPKETVAKTVRADLNNIDFPVAFKVCMKPSFNTAEVEKVGYTYTYSFFAGRRK